MLDPSDAERIENVIHAALDYIAEKGWVHALGYHAASGAAFIVSATQAGNTCDERNGSVVVIEDRREMETHPPAVGAAGRNVGVGVVDTT